MFYNKKTFLFLSSLVAHFFGRFLGSEVTMTAGKNVFFAFLFIIGCILIFRFFGFRWKNRSFKLLILLQILTLFLISFFFASLRLYVISHVFCFFSGFYVYVSSGEVVTHSGPSSPWMEDSREIDILLEDSVSRSSSRWLCYSSTNNVRSAGAQYLE